jgi:aminopeptidase N
MAVYTQTPPLEAGVSQKLAQWRAAHYSDVRYKLNITLEKGAPLMKGELEIHVNLSETGAKSDLSLDWRTTAFAGDKDKPSVDVVEVNASLIKQLPDSGNFAWATDKEHLIIAQRLLKAGENFIKIRFASPIKTSGAAVTRYVDREDGAEYVYSLFVPSDASTAFPVFDQPDLKARFQLNVISPVNWKAVSNTEFVKSEFNFGRGLNKDEQKGNLFIFNETKPISTYVFAFAAGDFAEFEEMAATVSEDIPTKARKASEAVKTIYKEGTSPSKIYVRKSQAEKFKAHEKEIFRLNRAGIEYLESYFDFKFPFPKYDLVLIPEFPFGGMEHAGATFLRESSIIFPSEPTANDFISRANVIFHEAAHQWFGDTVTMKWFDDLWLKEGFAEFMAYKTLEKTMPEYNAWKAFYERNKPLAYATDSTRGTTPIYQEIPNLSAAKSAYGNIVYRKAPSFLRQAEFYLGEDKFQRAVRAFLKKYQYKNAEWTDLVREFETASGQDLKDWGESWVKQRGMPIFKAKRHKDWKINEYPDIKNVQLVAFTPKDILGEGGIWTIKAKFLLRYKDDIAEEKSVEFTRKSAKTFAGSFIAFKKNEEPLFVFPNYQDYGYGIFLLDEKSREYVLKNIQNEKDAFLRSMMWGALWDSVREAELAPRDYVELAIKNISVETDELTISTILSRVSTAMNYYLSDAQRAQLAPRLEKTLLERMSKAETTGQKITFYRAYLNIASSDYSQQVLKKFLESGGKPVEIGFGFMDEFKFKIEVPILKTKDKFDIVAKLLILGNNEAEKLLAELEKTETSDDAKRYAYAARAGIATAENKAKFWNDFVGNREISESWIESAFAAFNSPRHAELTLPYLEKALAELPNLKRNRKIFFLGGWLSAFIGGQKDEKALAIINKFLADNPNLDKDLRLKILENVDVIERAVKIRKTEN